MRLKLIILLLFISACGFATHARSGYISYTCVKDFLGNYTSTYHFKITTYTDAAAVGADRCYETLIFTNLGINPMPDTLTLPRTNGIFGVDLIGAGWANCGNDDSTLPGEGVMLVYPYTASCGSINYGGVKVNTYEGNYTFASNTATYIFGMVDPNFDANVNYINNSSNVAFAVLDTLSLHNFGLNYNNSALASNPAIDSAYAGQTFYYNPGMIDPDGDSLSYSLIPYITGTQNTGPFYPVSGYSAPPNLTINAVTGELSWLNTPNTYGEYDVDILIREYRHVGSSMVEMGSTVFAVQLNVVCYTASGIEQITSNKEQVNIYPNPNNGSFVIEPSNSTKQIIQLYDVNGKLVLSQTINGKTTIDASSLNEGVYNISIISNDGVVNKRLVIVR